MQLLGFGDIATASITTCSTAGAAVGFFVGGLVGDALSKYHPHAARPAVNQLSIVLGFPLVGPSPICAEAHFCVLATLNFSITLHALRVVKVPARPAVSQLSTVLASSLVQIIL